MYSPESCSQMAHFDLGLQIYKMVNDDQPLLETSLLSVAPQYFESRPDTHRPLLPSDQTPPPPPNYITQMTPALHHCPMIASDNLK